MFLRVPWAGTEGLSADLLSLSPGTAAGFEAHVVSERFKGLQFETCVAISNNGSAGFRPLAQLAMLSSRSTYSSSLSPGVIVAVTPSPLVQG